MDSSLRLTDAAELTSVTKDCEICWKRKGHYTCPRCNLAYCGLACYKDPGKHLSCSELFYKDQVVNELKTLRLDDHADAENRQKMVDILRRSAKQLEIDPEFDDCGATALLDDLALIDQADGDDELEEDIDYEEVVELLKKIVNKNLVKNSIDIDTSKASPFIYSDLLQSAFVYAFLATLYDLDGECLNREAHESKLDPGFLTNWLDIQHTFASHVRANHIPMTSISDKIQMTVQIVSNEILDQAHRNFLNTEFFGQVIDDLALFSRHPSNFLIKIISFLYGQLEMRLASMKRKGDEPTEPQAAEKPLNVFHLNRQTTETKAESTSTKTKSRVEIKRPEKRLDQENASVRDLPTKPDTLPEAKADSTKVAIRAALRRLEFFFKWLNVNKSLTESPETKVKVQSDLDTAKTALAKEASQFREEKKFVEQNLGKLKTARPPGDKLIQEL